MIYDERICYENGNRKQGKKIYELHKFCECEKCKWRYKYLKTPRNTVTVTVRDCTKINDAKEFIEKWTCRNGKQWLETEYFCF